MVPAKGWKAPDLLQDGFPAFSSKAVSALQQLVAEGATIILTTSHKANYSIEEWKEIFRKRGIAISQIKKLDANIGNKSRKDEIMDWININLEDGNFVILDDDKSLNDLPAYLKAKLLLTASHIGLTEEHLERVRELAAIPIVGI
jgi:3-isopropylmalate dehydratase small subunit